MARPMGTYLAVDVGYVNHKKTERLRQLVGDNAPLYPLLLWSYAYAHHRDGMLPLNKIEKVCGWTGIPGTLVKALMECGGPKKFGFLEPDGKLHNWEIRAGAFLTRGKPRKETREERNTRQARERMRNMRNRRKLALGAERNAQRNNERNNERNKSAPKTLPEPIDDVYIRERNKRNMLRPVTPPPNEIAPVHAYARGKTKDEIEQEACMQQQRRIGFAEPVTLTERPAEQSALPGVPPAAPPKKPRARKPKPDDFTEADYAFVRMFRKDRVDTLKRGHQTLELPISPKELEAARGFRLEGWTKEQLIEHQRLFLHDGPRKARWHGDRDWPGWRSKVLSVHDWFRFRDELQKQITRADEEVEE